MLAGLWRATLISFFAGLIGCTGTVDQLTPLVVADPLPVPQHWSVFLVAGDNAAPVFDNAIARFDSLLSGPAFAPVHLFSADEAAGAELATSDNLSAAMTNLPNNTNNGCLVFITSHGSRDGVAMKADFDHDQRLTPARLATLLDDSCGSRSTVAIVSACFSGIFLDLAAPNRIILTAARADRTSFGCGAEFSYTYYDSCLLDQWPHAANFQLLYDAVVGCVREKERKLGITPSEPQAAFGAQVANLPLPH